MSVYNFDNPFHCCQHLGILRRKYWLMLQIIHKPLTVILTCVNHFYGIHISLLIKVTFLVRRLFYGSR